MIAAAELTQDVGSGFVDRSLIGNVGRKSGSTNSIGTAERFSSIDYLRIAIHEGDRTSFARKLLGDRVAQSSRSADDNRYLILKLQIHPSQYQNRNEPPAADAL